MLVPGRNPELALARWYSGRVTFITTLRPQTVIKDDAITVLLRTQVEPTFITINEANFWQRTALDANFCVVCFPISDARVTVIDSRMRCIVRLCRGMTCVRN